MSVLGPRKERASELMKSFDKDVGAITEPAPPYLLEDSKE